MNNSADLSKDDIQRIIKQRMEEASKDPLVFIDRFAYTFDPKTSPFHLPFRLYPFQRDLVNDVRRAIESGHDIFIEKCREMGATYTVLDLILWFWRYIPGSNFLLGSRKEDYVDNTGSTEVSNKEESLFGKLDYTLRHLPPFMLPVGFEWRRHFTFMSLINPENGNVIGGESANANFSRGGRRTAILMDEFAFWDNDGAAWGATADTTRCRIVLTTPGIKPSKAKRLRFGKDGEYIKVISLPYYLDPRKDEAWLDAERDRRSPSDFAREIMINWDKSIGGTIYTEFARERHVQPFDHEKDQYGDYYFGMDFAVRGWTAAIAGYLDTTGHIYILDEYKEYNDTASNHGPRINTMLTHYASFEKYTGYADPAGWSGTQQGTRHNRDMVWSIADEYTEQDFPIVRANNDVVAGINFVKQQFHKGNITIHPRCVKLIEELLEYRWKDVPEHSKETSEEPEAVRKINDHLCFCRHTRILTRNGYKDIIDVHKDDYVWSPLGWTKVLSQQQTDKKRVTAFRSMKATGNHPFLTQDGFRPLTALRTTDTLWSVSISSESHTDAIRMRQELAIGSISAVVRRAIQARRAHYTAMSGDTFTGTFRRVSMSIIRTLIPLIIASKTLWHILLPIISQSIARRVVQMVRGTSSSQDPSPLPGTNHPPQKNSTNASRNQRGNTNKQSDNHAVVAMTHTRRISLPDQSSAVLTAKCRCSGSVAVYNLVTDIGMYTAGDVVVSNCDALRYMLYSKPTAPEEDQSKLKPGMPIVFTMKLDEPDPDADQYTPMDIPDIFD